MGKGKILFSSAFFFFIFIPSSTALFPARSRASNPEMNTYPATMGEGGGGIQ